MKAKDVIEFIKQHKHAVILTSLGLLTAILMLTIGFFSTLLIILLSAVCFLYGWLLDKYGFSGANEVIRDFFKKLFGKH